MIIDHPTHQMELGGGAAGPRQKKNNSHQLISVNPENRLPL